MNAVVRTLAFGAHRGMAVPVQLADEVNISRVHLKTAATSQGDTGNGSLNDRVGPGIEITKVEERARAAIS
jgi:hypothetical protein